MPDTSQPTFITAPIYDMIPIGEHDRFQRAYRILEQAVNWNIVEAERDCQESSIGAHWRDRLKDARARAQTVLEGNEASEVGGESEE